LQSIVIFETSWLSTGPATNTTRIAMSPANVPAMLSRRRTALDWNRPAMPYSLARIPPAGRAYSDRLPDAPVGGIPDAPAAARG
jgi:hypothetical protein